MGFLKNNTKSINSVRKAFLHTIKTGLTVIQNFELGLANFLCENKSNFLIRFPGDNKLLCKLKNVTIMHIFNIEYISNK
jgi:hypothetical protein